MKLLIIPLFVTLYSCAPLLTYYNPSPNHCGPRAALWIMEESAQAHKNTPSWNTIAPAVYQEDARVLSVLRRLSKGERVSGVEIAEAVAIIKVYRDSHKPYARVPHLRGEHQMWVNRYTCVIDYLEGVSDEETQIRY